jgi:hypothetical protein
MFGFARTLTLEAMKAQHELLSWQMEQSKVAEKQMAQALESWRTNVKLAADLQQNVGRTLVDTLLPEKKAEA